MNIIPLRRELLEDINDRLDSLSSVEIDRIFRKVTIPDMLTLITAIDHFGRDCIEKAKLRDDE